MSRLTSFLGGAGFGFGAGFVWKNLGAFQSTAHDNAISRIDNIERAQAAVGSAMTVVPPRTDTAALESAIATIAVNAGTAWQKLHDLHHDIFALNDRGRISFEHTLQAFAAWPELLKKTIAAHPPQPAPHISAPQPAYPDVPATPELLALERDLTLQTEQRTEIELAAAQHESAATVMLTAVNELRQSLPPQGT